MCESHHASHPKHGWQSTVLWQMWQALLQILPQSAVGFLFGKNFATKRLSDFYLAANLNFSTPSADADAPPLGEGGNKHSLRSFKF